MFELIIMKTWGNKVKIFNENVDKQSQNTHVENIFAKSQRLEVGYRLFRIIFTLPKLKQKELALNSSEILQISFNYTRHFIEHGRAYIKIFFMMAE